MSHNPQLILDSMSRTLIVEALYLQVQRAGLVVLVPIEERWYRHDQSEKGNRQFVVADPDGYLLRFFSGSEPGRPQVQPFKQSAAR